MENIILWGDKELVAHTFSKSHGNGGRLSKFWLEDRITGREFLLKGSTVFGYEPLCEKIAYIVGKNLGIDVLEYDIIPLKNVKWVLDIKSTCRYVSICEKIDRKNYSIMSVAEIKRARNAILGPDEKPITNREVMYELLDAKYIDTMLLFDAIIGNNDRHYGNVHLLRGKDGKFIGAPILDNGASCLANTNALIAHMMGYKVGEYIDNSSTLEKKHEKQIMYASTLSGINFNIPVKTMEILDEIEPVLALMPKMRADAIRKYLTYRLHKYLGIIKNKTIPNAWDATPEKISGIKREKEHT